MGLKYAQVTISNATTTSNPAQIDGLLAEILMPAAFTGTTLTFTISDTQGGTYVTAKDTAGSTISYTAAASTGIKVPTDDFRGAKFIKLVPGSSEGADRIILLGLSTPD